MIGIFLPVALLVSGILHTAVRYAFRPASSLLPTELFTQPLLSGALASPGKQPVDAALRDPYYRANSGYLYLAQHDVFSVLNDLKTAGFSVVVFVDDLDRCSPSTTAKMFEALNVFLTKAFPTTRFILGLDVNAVVAHLDAFNSSIKSESAAKLEADPSAGWSYLRKFVQLQISMPGLASELIPAMMTDLLGPVWSKEQVDADSAINRRPDDAGSVDGGQQEREVSPQQADAASLVDTLDRSASIAALEHNAEIRTVMIERLEDQLDLSVREAKRLLTTWQFYVRVADLIEPRAGNQAITRARDLVLLAEIFVRWPAVQRSLTRRIEGRIAIALLAEAVDDDFAWGRALRKVGLSDSKYSACCTSLRKLLTTYGGSAVVALAEQLV
jgi:hypothetical protein